MEKWQRENLERLRTAMGPVELTEAEARTLAWLAGWDELTTENVCRIFRKVREVAGQ